MEYYVHQVPGRLRVRIPTLRGRFDKCEEIRGLLDIKGVTDIAVNAMTGSLLVNFDRDRVNAEALLNILHSHGCYDPTRVITCDQKIRRATNKAASHAGRAASIWVVGKALEANGLGLLAAII